MNRIILLLACCFFWMAPHAESASAPASGQNNVESTRTSDHSIQLAKGKKRRKGRKQNRNRQKRGQAAQSSVSSSGGTKFYQQSALNGTVGLMMWDKVLDGSALLFGAEYRLNLGGKLFIPFGFDRWSGDLYTPGFSGITMTMLSFGSGFGYHIEMSDTLTLPVGLRLGLSQMEIAFGEFTFGADGYHLTPTFGALFNIGDNLSAGYDFRIPLYILNSESDDEDDDDDEEEDDDDSESSGIPMQHLLVINFSF